MNNPELFDVYIAEMNEHLELLNESLLKLEKAPHSHDIVNNIFRSFHTMKGSTATMGYTHSAEIIHRMEDLLQEVRDGRVRVETELIQILFVCHDFIERLIEQISKMGTDEHMETGNLLDILVQYVRRDGEGTAGESKSAAPKPEPVPSVPIRNPELQPGPAELDYLRRQISGGLRAYLISMKIAEDCQFKAIRLWMAMELVEQMAEIIKAYPLKPSQEDFVNSTFVVTDTDIRALVVSERSGDEILQELESTLMEIEEIKVEEYPPKTVGDLIDSIIGDEGDLAASSQKVENFEAYLNEIKNQIVQSELFFLDTFTDRENTVPIEKIAQAFCVIKEMSSYIKHSVIFTISVQTEKLLEDFRTRKISVERRHMNILAKSLDFIKQICDDIGLSSNEAFINTVNDHLELYQAYKSGNLADQGISGADAALHGLKLGEILVKKGIVDRENVEEMLNRQSKEYPGLPLGKVIVKEEKASVKDVADALHIQQGSKTEQKVQSFIRVPEQKVDGLVDMLGELLIVQSLHRQEITDLLAELGRTDSKIFNNVLRMERITKDIQTVSMSLRMVSLKQTFQKLLRIGRDTALELQKDVDIEITGDETEIDRSIVEKIQDPLMHLVRNSISHGIESVEVRAANGKELQGKVSIRAYNKRGFVYIEVSDDGKGMDPGKLYEKALKKNLIDPERNYSDEEIIRFIYLPGFSTQEQIDSISGRGVGMNVVETEIVKIGGKIEIDNHPGRGSKFILKIPVNLATINGTMVDVCGGRYILPTLNIKQILKPESDQWVRIKGKTEMVKIRNEIIQIIPIDRILGIQRGDSDIADGMIIVVELERALRALPVSSVIGKQEIVVKPLNSDFRGLQFASGATILGDGRVSLILDLETMFRMSNV